MQFFLKNILPLLSRFIAALLCIAVTKLILQPFEAVLGIQIIALLYLLPIMASTVLWGLGPGIFAAIASFFVFNYFYIQPFHTLQVHQTQDLITLINFLV